MSFADRNAEADASALGCHLEDLESCIDVTDREARKEPGAGATVSESCKVQTYKRASECVTREQDRSPVEGYCGERLSRSSRSTSSSYAGAAEWISGSTLSR